MYVVDIYESLPFKKFPANTYYTDSWKQIKKLYSSIVKFNNPIESKKNIVKRNDVVVCAELISDTFSMIVKLVEPLDAYKYVDVGEEYDEAF